MTSLADQEFLEANAGLDECCAKELRDNARSAIMRAKLQAVDPTRIAVAARLHALGSLSRPTMRQPFIRDSCCASNPIMCQTCEETSSSQTMSNTNYDSDDSNKSNLSDDLDSMMDSFDSLSNKDPTNEQGGWSQEEERYRRSYRNKDQETETAIDGQGQITTVSTPTSMPPQQLQITLQQLHPDYLSEEYNRRPYVVFLLVSKFNGETTFNTYLDGIATHLSHLSTTYDLTTFYILVQPKEADCRRFGIDHSLPCIVCCMDGNVVARSVNLEQFRGRMNNGLDVSERLDPWLEQCRMIGSLQRSPELFNQLYPGSENEEEYDDEDLQSKSTYCNLKGCGKHFNHTHINSGMSMNAQDLAVT